MSEIEFAAWIQIVKCMRTQEEINGMIKESGQPIKERGIKWAEAYTDKSAYLKESFDEQVGPGAYYRWEGHDFTTNCDYYVVVTPGFSKKHGYHFFAGLRKEPATNGASGKHFSTQGEALSYAMDHWNVPRPQSSPHKPYVTKDLEGKSIVTENVHSAMSENTEIKISGRGSQSMIIIDASDEVSTPVQKTAMAVGSMRGTQWFKQPGPNSFAGDMQWMALARLTMKNGSAAHSKKSWVTVDAHNWQENELGHNELTGQSGVALPQSPFLATCVEPNPQEFDEMVNQRGITIENPLFDIDGEDINFRQPSEIEGSTLVHFADVTKIKPTIKVSSYNRAALENAVREMGPSALTGRAPRISATTPNDGSMRDHVFTGDIPIDMYEQFVEAVSPFAAVDLPDYKLRNASALYDYFERNGKLQDPVSRQQALSTPVFERFNGIKGGQALVYDGDVPVEINLTKSRQVKKESDSEGGTVDDTKYVLKSSKVPEWLQRPDVNGSHEILRQKLSSGEIPLQASDFILASTCAPKLAEFHRTMPNVDIEGLPQTDESGNVTESRRNVIPEYTCSAHEGVRVYDPETGMKKYIPIPEDVNPHQTFNGARLISSASKMHFTKKDGTIQEVKCGELKHYDPDSKGKFAPGNFYRFTLAPKNASPRGSDAKLMHELGLSREGFFAGYVETYATKTRVEGEPTDPNDPNITDIVRDNTGKITAHSVIGERQHAPKPISTEMPLPGKPKMFPMYEQGPNGEVIRAVHPDGTPKEFAITSDDAYGKDEITKKGLYFKSFAKAIEFMRSKYAMSVHDIGPWTDYDHRDLRMIDERAIVAKAKIKAINEGKTNPDGTPIVLDDAERMLSLFPKFNPAAIRVPGKRPGSTTKGKINRIPIEFLKSLSEIKSDPDAYGSKTGPIYGVMNLQDSLFVNDETFATEEKAKQFMDVLNRSGRFSEQDLQVQVVDTDAPLVISYRDKLEEDPNAKLTHDTDAYEGLGDLDGLDDAPENTQQEQEQEAQDDDNITDVTDDMIVDVTDDMIVHDDEEQQPQQAEEEPIYQPEATEQEEPFFDPNFFGPKQPQQQPQPQQVQQEPYFDPHFFDRKKPSHPAPQLQLHEGSALGRLMKLANRLDEEGKFEESAAVDRIIKSLAKRS